MEVAYATPDKQVVVEVELDAASSVSDAIESSGLQAQFPDTDLNALAIGIWGREVGRAQRLREGDRVEIYRPLDRDPRDARRALADAQRSGSSS